MKAQTTFSLKDQLVNPQKVDLLIHGLKQADPQLNLKKFRRDVLKALPQLELKERLQHITTCLHELLPTEYSTALKLILKALPAELDPKLKDNDFGEYIYYPYSLYVATYGCQKKHLRLSFKALKEITKRFSAEEAIRFFINTYPKESFEYLTTCVQDKNYHVRRWVSEGTRPKLPWAQKISTPAEKPIEFLNKLYCDPTRYVTRSVANHLNDISKLDPELVISQLKHWQKEGKQEPGEFDYIIRHSLRTLIKQGHPKALKLLGYQSSPKAKIKNFKLKNRVIKINSRLDFSFTVESSQHEKLMIDYCIENLEKKSKKVFKLKQLELEKHSQQLVKKSHPFKLMTTRSLHSGKHRLSIQINGRIFYKELFELKIP